MGDRNPRPTQRMDSVAFGRPEQDLSMSSQVEVDFQPHLCSFSSCLLLPSAAHYRLSFYVGCAFHYADEVKELDDTSVTVLHICLPFGGKP